MSDANERTADRRYGWSLRGFPAIKRRPFKCTERWSILPAYALCGYIDWEIIKGGFNTATLNAFIQNKVLPRMNPWPTYTGP
jgi:hypothetical protein